MFSARQELDDWSVRVCQAGGSVRVRIRGGAGWMTGVEAGERSVAENRSGCHVAECGVVMDSLFSLVCLAGIFVWWLEETRGCVR